jgi:TadE-like protein
MSFNFRILKSRFKALKHETSGVAAVEFALILPVMLLMYVGVVEITRLYAADRKAVVFAHTIADLATQADNDKTTNIQTLKDGDITLIFGLASAVLVPFNEAGASMRLTMFAFDGTVPASGAANGFIDWQDVCTLDGTGISCTPDVSAVFGSAKPRCTRELVDQGFATKNGYTMRAEVAFTYKPLFYDWSIYMPGSDAKKSVMDKSGIDLKDQLYMQPRGGANVVRISSSTAKDTSASAVAIKCAPEFKIIP